MQASTQLVQVVRVISTEPSALQLRYLQTLTDIAVDKSSTIVFPLPLDIIRPFMNMMQQNGHREHATPALERYDDPRYAEERP